jgi:hypothetical protein
MSKKVMKRILVFFVIVVFTNLPPVYIFIHLYEIIDMQHYTYSNSDDPETTIAENFGSPFDFRTKVYDEYRVTNPNNDTLLYRNFWKNPLCFWRWKEYFTDEKYKLPYISREDVIRNAKKKSIKKNRISRIGFATGGCHGTCPYLAIEIDSTLTYTFFGGKYAKKKGFFKGVVSRDFWDTLNQKFERIQYRNLDTLYNSSVDDLAIECYLMEGQERKSIYGQDMSMPDSLREVLYWVLNSYEKIDLMKVDTLFFQTEIQYRNRPIPHVKLLKFIPPENNQ